MDLVCNGHHLHHHHHHHHQRNIASSGNVVQVREQQRADALDLLAPGYSVIGEPQVRDAGPEVRPRYLENGRDEQRAEGEKLAGKAAPAGKQQVAAGKPSSRLRQLLHLEPKSKPGQNGTNCNGKGNNGYSADSHSQQSEQSVASSKSGPTTKKSWLMSRFSLSSNNLATSHQQTANNNNNHSDQLSSGRASQEAPTLINRNQSNGSREQNVQQPEVATNYPNEHSTGQTDTSDELADHQTVILNNKELENGGLIRPKSALSGRSSELIAAQKSLAAAAAAKVKRDRLFKMSGDLGQQQQQQQQVRTTTGVSANHSSSAGVLTVKTSGEPFGWNHHRMLVAGQPLANGVNSGQKYIIGSNHPGGGQRSGTNSVGMSDSSPSNNGAESDNSIQTTTTDTTSGGQPAGEHPARSHSSPLGILSRILLNSKSAGAIRQVAESRLQPAPGSSATESGKPSHQPPGGSLSSSALSSPASDDAAHQSSPSMIHDATELASSPGAVSKLDQLGSRSRRPIVLTRSNELPVADNLDTSAPEANSGPRLPPKSALKPAQAVADLASRWEARQRAQVSSSGGAGGQLPMEPMNGLPRVASYTQISTLGSQQDTLGLGGYQHQHQASGAAERDRLARHQSLCNYHAMNRNHNQLIQQTSAAGHQHYNYLPYELARYSLHGHPACDPSTVGHEKYPHHHHHHLSHHDLRAQHSSVDLAALPSSAINYEYYLEAPIHQHQRVAAYAAGADNSPYGGQSFLNHVPSRYQSSYSTTTAAMDNSIYRGYANDDSIYIPYLNGMQVRDTGGASLSARPATAMASAIAGCGTSDFDSDNKRRYQHTSSHQQVSFGRFNRTTDHLLNHDVDPSTPTMVGQQRPKSSLDTFHLSSSAVPPPLPMANQVAGAKRAAPASGIGIMSRNSGLISASDAVNHLSTLSSSSSSSSDHQHQMNEKQQQPPTHYPYPSSSASSSTLFNNDHSNSASGYVYSENSIYASDQSTAAFLSQHSDLTVLPTTATATTTTETTNSTSSSYHRQSPSVKQLLTEGGSNNDGHRHTAKGERDEYDDDDHHHHDQQHELITNKISSAQVEESLASSSPTPKAVVRKQDKASSSGSTQPASFRSLVQVNQSSSSNCNQSSLKGEVAPSSTTTTTTTTIATEKISLSNNLKVQENEPRLDLNKTDGCNGISRTTITVKPQHLQPKKVSLIDRELSTVIESSPHSELEDGNDSTVL